MTAFDLRRSPLSRTTCRRASSALAFAGIASGNGTIGDGRGARVLQRQPSGGRPEPGGPDG